MPRFMKALNNISRCQAIYRNTHLSCEGICAAHHPFLFAVCRVPGRSQDEIAKELCLNKSTVTRTITYLEEQGFLTRVQSATDKRQFSVFPTEKLNAIFPAVTEISKNWNEALSAGIPTDQMEIFYSVLQRLEARAKNLIREEVDEK